jgi:predicted GNAT superfamily acetyltransferase
MFDGTNLPISENMTSRDITDANAMLIVLDIDSSTWEMGDYDISVTSRLSAIEQT